MRKFTSYLFAAILLVTGIYGCSKNNSKKPLVVILIGPPGVGKGTQASELSKALNLPHISTGDLLRDNIKRQTPIGIQIQNIIAQGNFVSDELINALIYEKLTSTDCTNGYILDGYPRRVPQAETLDSYLKDRVSVKVVHYFADDKIIIDRISGRLLCTYCEKNFHKLFNPPKEDGKCDNCFHELIQRADDAESVVVERLLLYKQNTEPLIDFYKNKHLLQAVSCEGSVKDIFEKTLKLLNN